MKLYLWLSKKSVWIMIVSSLCVLISFSMELTGCPNFGVAQRISLIMFASFFSAFLAGFSLRWVRGSFDLAFEFNPPTTEAEIVLSQAAVDKKLTKLAENLDYAFESENRYRARVRAGAISNQEEIPVKLRNLREASRIEKYFFWKAHKLARRFGFRTYRSYKGYLGGKPF